jgi:putative tricarboxylic transport membrane protein
MTRLYHIVNAVLILFGALVVYWSVGLDYMTDYGPGPGFFSFWLGLILILLAGNDIIGCARRPAEPLPADFLPDREGRLRILYIGVALTAAIFLLEPLGFSLSMVLFCVFLLRAVGRQSWWATLLISAVGSFGTFYLFNLLQVPLPRGFWGL